MQNHLLAIRKNSKLIEFLQDVIKVKNKKKVLLICVFVLFSLFLCSCACSECKGEEQITCSVCIGEGKVQCPVENCTDGITRLSCKNCGGRKGVHVCYTCDGGKETRQICENCGGDGTIRNPITWQEFKCKDCNGKGAGFFKCKTCQGYGICCNYCGSNPSKDYPPYAVKCETCLGDGQIECESCMGNGKMPCSKCTPEEYEVFLDDLEKYKYDKHAEPIYEEAMLLLKSGKYDEAEKLFLEIDKYIHYSQYGSKYYLNKITEFRKSVEEAEELFRPYVGYWQYVSGDVYFFDESSKPTQKAYLLQADILRRGTYSEEVYLRFRPVSKEVKASKDSNGNELKLSTFQEAIVLSMKDGFFEDEYVKVNNIYYSLELDDVEILENGNLRFTKTMRPRGTYYLEVKKEN